MLGYNNKKDIWKCHFSWSLGYSRPTQDTLNSSVDWVCNLSHAFHVHLIKETQHSYIIDILENIIFVCYTLFVLPLVTLAKSRSAYPEMW